MKRFLTTIMVAAFTVLVTAPASADLAPGTAILAGPGTTLTNYFTPVAVVNTSGAVNFVNTDINYHDVTSDTVGSFSFPWCSSYAAGACPLFRTDLIGTGETQVVQGTANLAPGRTYTFHCTPHPWMKGTLVVPA